MYSDKYRKFSGIDGSFDAFILGKVGSIRKCGITRHGEVVDLDECHRVICGAAYLSRVEWAKMVEFEDKIDTLWSTEKNSKRRIEDAKRLWSRVFEEDRLISIEEAEEYIKKCLNRILKNNGYSTRIIVSKRESNYAVRMIISRAFTFTKELENFANKGRLVGYSDDKIQDTGEFFRMSSEIMRHVGKFELRELGYSKNEEVVEYHGGDEFYHAIVMNEVIAITEKGIQALAEVLGVILQSDRDGV